ncbi:MAG: glycosyltransferase [Paraprevotella sp.]|nr:glycosyltransferase [Paraprevotella sp.]
MATVSIIIPVYNTGKYLYKCVESLLSQTLNDIEIIMVDDGSREETAAICDELAVCDNRIKIFHKQNEGVSIARNYGLDRATGKYIGFVDSDDWVDINMFQTLVATIERENADLVYCDATTIWDDGRTEPDSFANFAKSGSMPSKELKPSELCEIAGSAWRALYKFSYLKEHNIRFPEGLKFSEDRIFNLLVLSHASRIYYLKQSFYFRYMRADSCVNSYHPDATSIVIRSSCIMQELAEEFWGEKHRKAYQNQMVTGFIGYLYGVITRPKKETSRYQEFKTMAATPQLHEAIATLNLRDIRSRLIASNDYRMLYLLMLTHTCYKKFRS